MDATYEAAPDRRSATRPLQAESRIALWVCLSTACRIGELLLAEWKHIDLDQRTWFIPVENVKGTRGKKQEYHVQLSRFALRQFMALHALTGGQRWCFQQAGWRSATAVRAAREAQASLPRRLAGAERR
jgi:integrase